MVKRPAYQPSKFAHEKALHYLARLRQYRLSDHVRHDLTEVVRTHVGNGDGAAARRGVEWMRDQARVRGEPVTF
jgi:hypothetical protein